MASQVLMKMPVTYNNQIVKKGVDTIRAEPTVPVPYTASDPTLRIAQLEQNINFLKEQHHAMLLSLHQEIENLRIRNRDLQFQLIFGNSGVKVTQSSSDSSPDDGPKTKVISPRKEINNRSLQVEMLEKEVAELKMSLSEANAKNATLLQIIDEQKMKIDASKKDTTDQNAATRLDDAENLIKRLVKENDEQRKEVHSLRGQLSKSGGSGGRYNRRGNNGDHQRFPPLQTQNFWGHGTQKHKSGPDYSNGRAQQQQQQLDHEVVGQTPPSLPHLNRAYSQPSSNQRHKHYSNGNHVYRGNSHDDGGGGVGGGDGRRRYRGRGNGGHHKEDN